MVNQKYKQEIALFHNESPAAIDNETGELRQISTKNNHSIKEDHELFEPKASFRKDYTNSWMFLERVLKPIEFKAAFALALKAKANTNSLEPLNDDTAKSELMAILGVSKNMVNPILEKLYILGVYGRFDVYEVNKPYTKYWVFNPYLSFQGKLLKSDIASLFKNTHCARAFYNPEYNPILKK